MSTVWFSPERIMSRARMAANKGLNELAEIMARDARRRAPIRKVFIRHRRKFRPLTAEERAFAIARARHYYTYINPNPKKLARAVAHLMTSAKVELPVPGDLNALVRSRSMRVLGYRRRGKFYGRFGATEIDGGAGYEPGPEVARHMRRQSIQDIRQGIGVYTSRLPSGAARIQMGGRLKASIHAEPARSQGTRETATVAASVYYAQFVEFPTVKTAAQPFLRPAMHAYKDRLVKMVAQAWRRGAA